MKVLLQIFHFSPSTIRLSSPDSEAPFQVHVCILLPHIIHFRTYVSKIWTKCRKKFMHKSFYTRRFFS